ncbi:MAG TPA: DUF4040 domain-containing protein [Candidatus Hydrogenedentes bacterium]|nr:DUF4040 domain-containing protein [Candidatus Hydrogenedentota bacterium]
MLAIYIVLMLMIIGAVIAIEIKSLLSSVIAVGAVGMGLSLIALILNAPDVAITQLVVEIISVIILIRATIKKDLPESTTEQRVMSGVAALVFLAALVLVGIAVFKEIPPFGQPIMRVAGEYLANGVQETGATNIVASILLDYRGYDTLGEATVLFTAVLGVLTVVRRQGKKSEKSGGGSDHE